MVGAHAFFLELSRRPPTPRHGAPAARVPEQCAELCNIYGRGCKGFEILVDYGIRGGRRDDHCTLQDSANYKGCNGAS